jgi:hypothetical protein
MYCHGSYEQLVGALLAQQHDLVIAMISMWDSIFVFVLISLLNQTLLTCMDVLPVRSMLDIEYHVSPKDQ